MYNPIPDLIILGGFLIALSVVMYVTRKRPVGATKGDKWQVKAHQNNRRFRMARGDYHEH